MNIENIKFRGKRVRDGKWVHGFYCPCVIRSFPAEDCIVVVNEDSWGQERVSPNTIGQYTGLKDRNGVEIYVGDIVREKSVHWRTPDKVETEIYAVKCDYLGSLHLVRPIPGGERTTLLTRSSWVEVLGNIYDNPELLEVIK